MALLQNISKERKKELPLLMALGDGTRPETASPADGKAVSDCGLFVINVRGKAPLGANRA